MVTSRKIAVVLTALILLSGSVEQVKCDLKSCQKACMATLVACFLINGFTYGAVPQSIITGNPGLSQCMRAYSICMTACLIMGDGGCF